VYDYCKHSPIFAALMWTGPSSRPTTRTGISSRPGSPACVP
jgi:hypothetical protein